MAIILFGTAPHKNYDEEKTSVIILPLQRRKLAQGGEVAEPGNESQ